MIAANPNEETEEMREYSLALMSKVNYNNYVKKHTVQSKTFYKEGEGPKLAKVDGGVKAQLCSGELGIAKVYSGNKRAQWYIKGPSLNSDIGIVLANKKKLAAYGKLSLVGASGSINIFIPYSRKILVIGLEGDLFSIGGGLEVDNTVSKKIKFGVHYGIGGDVILEVK
ncbi:hypothetical protein Q428_14045 [Fervidicella metallireducens AeB]|uniref:Uncharacterized protein n=2 Tax=Fervidicella TaxID=1403538 RepID=A0A017RRL9_9CLOT|nr:hypothetical protein Q428_14045 [Fervidicella metallireducens AeB]